MSHGIPFSDAGLNLRSTGEEPGRPDMPGIAAELPVSAAWNSL
ncbi:hypothetical protein [Streptomyces sp. NPDC058545]